MPHPLVPSQEWVYIMERHFSLLDIIDKEEEGEEEKLSDENSYPFEKDQNAEKDIHGETLANFSFESFFKDQLNEISLKRDMVDQEYNHEPSSPSQFSELYLEENFTRADLEVEEPLNQEGEGGIDQENQEQEIMAFVCSKGIDFNMVSCRIYQNVGLVSITCEERGSEAKHDSYSRVDHDILIPLLDEAFADELFMDIFFNDQLSKERLEEDNTYDEPSYALTY